MGQVHTSGPNEALVVSGGCCSSHGKRIIVGGYAWASWFVSDVQRLSLEVITLAPRCEDVETLHGVALTVSGVTQIRFMQDHELLKTAAEQFLGKTPREIGEVVLQTVEGHLRAILGGLSVEDIYQEREKFAESVRQIASPDLGRMAIEILSFVVVDLEDKHGYLDSLGKKRTAEVKRDADIGVAEAIRDAGIKQSEADKARLDVRYKADTAIADSKRQFEIAEADYAQEVNTKKAVAELAGELQSSKVNQAIRQEEIEIEVVERRKQIEVEEQEIMRRERELDATVKKPAHAERFRMETLADAYKFRQITAAEAEYVAISQIGNAEAAVIEAKGKAEANAMSLKAKAYREYGHAAKTAMVLENLPRIAAEVAAPLARTTSMVVIGSEGSKTGAGKVTAELSDLLATLPVAVHALTGVDVSKALQAIPGVSGGAQ